MHIDLDGLYGIRELGNRLRRPNCPAVGGSLSQITFWQRFPTSKYPTCQKHRKSVPHHQNDDIMLNTTEINHLLHFLSVFTRKSTPRQVASWLIWMESHWKTSMGRVFEITRCLKFSWYRDLGGMGVRFVVEYNVSWCCYNNPSGLRWNPHHPRRSRVKRFGTADFPSNSKLFLVQHNL